MSVSDLFCCILGHRLATWYSTAISLVEGTFFSSSSYRLSTALWGNAATPSQFAEVRSGLHMETGNLHYKCLSSIRVLTLS